MEMDSRIGLDYIVENREYISKLGTALDTQNVTVKKQVFELLSALCAYNSEGYTRAIETLEFYKNLKKERYRFQIVINELEKATDVEYQVALIAFINCVIISAASLQDRIRIRNEFIGVRVLPTLNNLRKVAQSVGDIVVQLDVFDEQRECDEAQSLQGPNGINLNSHLDVFYAILRQVADTPQEVPFLSILQHLLRIEPKESISDVIWDTAEKLVHRATLLETHEDSVRLLRTTTNVQQKFTCPHCRGETTSPSRKQASSMLPLSPVPTSSSSQKSLSSTPTPPPPPPPPPLPQQQFDAPVPPPPPPPAPFQLGAQAAAAGGGYGVAVAAAAAVAGTAGFGAPPPPPPVPPPIPGSSLAPPPPLPNILLANSSGGHRRSHSHEPSSLPDLNAVRLPQQETPAPKAKMKTLNWGKIPPNKVIGKQNIWTIVANEHQDSPRAAIDWTEMEGLFCLQANASQGSPKLGRASSYDTTDRKAKKENMEITLLDGKRSLNVNIFLKQFRSSNEAIMELICQGAHTEFGAEKLRGLLKLLPEVDELDLLKSFNGEKARLGNAEKFLLQLLEVSNYKLRIESMLLKSEFSANIEYLDPCINAMIYAGEDLINNKMLQEVLYIVLVAGNFLNSGGYAGNAAGVKLTSLQKLTDIRANKPGMNLIHFVAMQVEKRSPELLQFPAQLSALESATKTSSEQITNEINALDSRIRVIKQQVELSSTDPDIKLQMAEFLENAEREIFVLKGGMKEVESMRLKLAEFFCEDPAAFKLEECYKIFYNFCDKFKRAVLENERRRHQEAQATLRRKQREEQLSKKNKQSAANTPISDADSSGILDPTFDPRASPALPRRRIGSLNNGIDQSNAFIRLESNDGMSPDITPNGSLRRRRSRVLAEEDELMEFLRSSAGYDHNSRERKAYGSLDRSWARRNRSSSSSRKRPDILSIDFGNERERASSPGPMLHQQDKQSPSTPQQTADVHTPPQATHEDAKPRISREWRQKIETWLQSNENDEKQNEEYKRKRRLVNSNRRSLENEPDNERKLDTLEEEKIIPSNNATTTSTANPPINSANQRSNVATANHNLTKYERVYPDWRPSKTLEQTDVVGTLQAIAEVNNKVEQSQSAMTQKKPYVNKNNNTLHSNNNTNNTPNNTDHCKTIDDLRQYRKQRSLEAANEKQNLTQLQAIEEEDRRKSLLHQLADNPPAPSDHLEIFVLKAVCTEKEKDSTKSTKPMPSANAVHTTKITTHQPANTQHQSPTASAAPSPQPNHTKTASYTKVTTETIPSPAATTTTTPSSPTTSSTKSQLSDHHHHQPQPQSDDTFASLLDHHKSHNEQYSRKEIDADNIETPPVHRRVLASPAATASSAAAGATATGKGSTSTLIKLNIAGKGTDETPQPHRSSNADEHEPAQLQPGTFDRHSLVRRTRRYKRSTDNSSGNEDGYPLSRESSHTKSPLPTHKSRKLPDSSHADDVKSSVSPRTPAAQKTLHKVEKLGRHISSINQEDVREAIRNLKSPTSTPERIWSPPRDSITQPTSASTTTTALGATKFSTHELNDEGFEETQSLVSDSASHGKGESTTSSCNEANEVPTTTKSHANTNGRSGTLLSSSRSPRASVKVLPVGGSSARSKSHAPPPQTPTAERRALSTTRPGMATMRHMPQGIRHAGSATTIPYGSSSGPISVTNIRRAESARKVSDKSVPKPSGGDGGVKRNIELTSSRNSLSSRSSINSGASINTVVARRPHLLAQKSPLLTHSSESSPNKRPLAIHNNIATARSQKSVPASRSSSSGSSVGANIVVVRHLNNNNNSNQKMPPSYQRSAHPLSAANNENSTSASKSPRTPSSSRSALLVKAALENFHKSSGRVDSSNASAAGNSSQKLKPGAASQATGQRGLSSFMRPTASSATKRNK